MFKRLFDALNTSLGIWFLSSVVLGGVSFGYTKLSVAYAEAAKRQEAVLRAKLEVSQRLAQVVAQYERLRRTKPDDLAARSQELGKFLNLAVQPPSGSGSTSGTTIYAAYPEFRDRPLLSMSIELLTLESSEENRRAIRQVYKWTLLVLSAEFEGKSVDEIKAKFQEIQVNKYWRIPE